jgi:hypothetical protein
MEVFIVTFLFGFARLGREPRAHYPIYSYCEPTQKAGVFVIGICAGLGSLRLLLYQEKEALNQRRSRSPRQGAVKNSDWPAPHGGARHKSLLLHFKNLLGSGWRVCVKQT